MTPNELSAANVRVREAAKLAQKKFRRESGCILIEGTRLVADALASGATVREIFCTQAFLDSDHGKAIRICCGDIISAITEAAAAKLSDTRSPQGVFAVVEFAPATLDTLTLGIDALVLVADNIADPGNLGTMIRSAAALGAQCVIASGDSCDPGNPKVVRATMGALFRVPVAGEVALADVVKTLRSHGLQLAAAVARGGLAPWEADLDRPTALLIGSEADGLPADAVRSADVAITIPMHHGAESLNAAACAAALLYEAARQRAKGGSGAAVR